MLLAVHDLIDFLPIGLIILFFVGYVILESVVSEIDQRKHPEREARRLQFKPLWKFISILTWNGGVIGALLLRGDGAAALAAVLLLASYGIFRYFLVRSPGMQRWFLAHPPPSNASSK